MTTINVQLTNEQWIFIKGELEENARMDYHVLTEDADHLVGDDRQHIEESVEMRTECLAALKAGTYD